MRRGDVWWARLPPPANPRPVVLVMREDVYSVRGFITVAPVTRTRRNLQSRVSLGQAEGLRVESVADLDSIITIDKRLFERRIGSLSDIKMSEVEDAIRFALDLPPFAR